MQAPPRHIALLCYHHQPDDIVNRITATLQAQGARVTRHLDGDPAVLSADAILITGNLPHLRLTPALLRTAPRRPPVAVWVYEPILPPDLPGWALRWGQALTTAARDIPGTNRRYLRLVRPLYLPVALMGMGKWSATLMAKDAQFIFEYTTWITTALSQGLIDILAPSTLQRAEGMRRWPGLRRDPVFLPLNIDYDPTLPLAPDSARDIDVLFLGRLSSPRRILTLWRIARRLRARGVHVRIVTGGLRGAARAAVLSRTRILLHLAKYPWDTPWMRWYMGAAQGVAIASEPQGHPAPFRPGIDHLCAPAGQLADTIATALRTPGATAALVTNCRARIEAEATLALGVRRLLAALFPAEPDPPHDR